MVNPKIDAKPDTVEFAADSGSTAEVSVWIDPSGGAQWEFETAWRDGSQALARVDREDTGPGACRLKLTEDSAGKLDPSRPEDSATLRVLAKAEGCADLERYIKVIVGQEGLFIDPIGRNAEDGSYHVLADGTGEPKEIDFRVYVRDSDGAVHIDNGLAQELQFTPTDEPGSRPRNGAEVAGLKIEFASTRGIDPPSATYHAGVEEPIPGDVPVLPVRFDVSVPGQTDEAKFTKPLTLGLVPSRDAPGGPDWQLEYNRCNEIIDELRAAQVAQRPDPHPGATRQAPRRRRSLCTPPPDLGDRAGPNARRGRHGLPRRGQVGRPYRRRCSSTPSGRVTYAFHAATAHFVGPWAAWDRPGETAGGVGDRRVRGGTDPGSLALAERRRAPRPPRGPGRRHRQVLQAHEEQQGQGVGAIRRVPLLQELSVQRQVVHRLAHRGRPRRPATRPSRRGSARNSSQRRRRRQPTSGGAAPEGCPRHRPVRSFGTDPGTRLVATHQGGNGQRREDAPRDGGRAHARPRCRARTPPGRPRRVQQVRRRARRDARGARRGTDPDAQGPLRPRRGSRHRWHRAWHRPGLSSDDRGPHPTDPNQSMWIELPPREWSADSHRIFLRRPDRRPYRTGLPRAPLGPAPARNGPSTTRDRRQQPAGVRGYVRPGLGEGRSRWRPGALAANGQRPPYRPVASLYQHRPGGGRRGQASERREDGRDIPGQGPGLNDNGTRRQTAAHARCSHAGQQSRRIA